ncbi:MAG: carboxylesterase family protein [Pseudomonadales bacterium]
MKKVAIILIAISIAVVSWYLFREEEEAPPAAPTRVDVTIRSTDAGDVVGFIYNGARAWLGIPFAAPPVGELRWRAPQPPQPWSGVREALATGPMCPQKSSALSGGSSNAAVAGDEDCLYLNVWSPPNARRLPVMVWIHGGGNSIGTGGTYNGAALATGEQVVVVTINYRLGPFGWFSHPALATGSPTDDSGNYGTLDIIRALEWTRDNIENFGGDPGNVTIFGESAGAFDVLSMMASPLAKGLFHRAVSESGGYNPASVATARNYTEDGGHPFSAREVVNRLLVADGTVPDLAAARSYQDDMSPGSLRDYLYAKTPEEIFALWGESALGGMINSPDLISDGYVLPDLPPEQIFSDPANYNAVPVILGTNRDEPALFMMMDPRWTNTTLWVFRRLKDEDAYLRAVKYGALAWKARGVDELAELMSAAGNPHVYTYRFDYDEQESVLGFELSKALGAAHFLEVPFVFGDFENFPLQGIFPESEGRDALSRSMMSYWAQFAYTGDPGRGREGTEVPWQPWGEDGKRSLILDTPEDRGIRMTDELVTRDRVVAMLASDTSIPTQEERCRLYLSSFAWGGKLDREEYASLGEQGCREYDPASTAGR